MCVSVALCIQHAMRMRRIILSSVACPALQYFSTLSHKRHDFRSYRTQKSGVLISLELFLSGTFLILQRNERDMSINVYRNACKLPVISVRF